MKIKENNFVYQLQIKNEKALAYIISEYGGLVMSVIRKHLFLMEDMEEECFDDVFLSVWEHSSSFDEEITSFKNWIAGIARYKAIDYLRKYRTRLDDIGLDGITVSNEDQELLKLIDREISEEMDQMLSCLNDTDKQLFMKLYVEEKEIDVVCEETGMNKNVIYKRLSRGKQKIRSQFSR